MLIYDNRSLYSSGNSLFIYFLIFFLIFFFLDSENDDGDNISYRSYDTGKLYVLVDVGLSIFFLFCFPRFLLLL